MSDIKRRKLGAPAGTQKKHHAPESSPPPAPSSASEDDASSDEEESATLDGAAAEESTEKPKTFKDLVRIYIPSASHLSTNAIADWSGNRRLVM